MNLLKKALERRRIKRTFREFGYEIRKFQTEILGEVEYAQWLHPFETPKRISQANIEFFKRLSPPGGMVIDIGAHTGDTTVPMALAVGKQGLVLGLEPNKYVYKILEKNASLNSDKTNIIPLCFAATKEDGIFSFNYSDASFCNGGFLSEIKNKNHNHDFVLDVAGKNLQTFLMNEHQANLGRLSLIKIDAEGYDKEIVKTIPHILNSYRPNMMMECYKRLNKDERFELFDAVSAFGYHLYYVANFESLGELRKIEKYEMMNREHFEILAIHHSRRLNFHG